MRFHPDSIQTKSNISDKSDESDESDESDALRMIVTIFHTLYILIRQQTVLYVSLHIFGFAAIKKIFWMPFIFFGLHSTSFFTKKIGSFLVCAGMTPVEINIPSDEISITHGFGLCGFLTTITNQSPDIVVTHLHGGREHALQPGADLHLASFRELHLVENIKNSQVLFLCLTFLLIFYVQGEQCDFTVVDNSICDLLCLACTSLSSIASIGFLISIFAP